MENSKKFLSAHSNEGGDFLKWDKKAGITVKLIADKETKVKTFGSEAREDGMAYLFEFEGEQKKYETTAYTLISKLALCEPGDVVTIKLVQNGAKSSYEVTKEGQKIGSEEEVSGEVSEEASW